MTSGEVRGPRSEVRGPGRGRGRPGRARGSLDLRAKRRGGAPPLHSVLSDAPPSPPLPVGARQGVR
jgi:hypothetical protein